jgi:polyferredoxin
MSGALLMPEDRVLSTLNADGSRRWLQPRLSPGRFLSARRVVGYGLIGLFVSLPHVRINGKPPILLDVVRREFTFFGATFLPTDTPLLAMLLLLTFLTIFFVTALLGRVWCGWACPQTVYLEMVFRPLERVLGGSKSLGGERLKPAMKVARYGVYGVLSFVLANTFLAYFVGTDQLWHWVIGSPLNHLAGFTVVMLVTALMMFDFSFFREQTCIIACPYGRMQSVLLDRYSMIVTYDRKRGEPRGKMGGKKAGLGGAGGLGDGSLSLGVLGAGEAKRGCGGGGGCGGTGGCGGKGHAHEHEPPHEHDEDHACGATAVASPAARIAALLEPSDAGAAGERAGAGGAGDCIDCQKCVTTCPTGIDIRNGLQLECIGCAQCIDACDEVMAKIGKPKGLVRYSSRAIVEGQTERIIRPRVLVYAGLLMVVASAFVTVLLTRATADVGLLRHRGMPFNLQGEGLVINQLKINVVNRSAVAQGYTFDVVWPERGVRLTGIEQPMRVMPGGSGHALGLMELDRSVFDAASQMGSLDVRVRVRDGDQYDRVHTFRALGPMAPAEGGAGAVKVEGEVKP